MPWLGALSQAKEGQVDATVAAFKDDAQDLIFQHMAYCSFLRPASLPA